jgi:hypothetical protein
MTSTFRLLSFLSFILASASCSFDGPNAGIPVSARDAVLSPGESVTFNNPNGFGILRYVSPFEREAVIDGETYRFKMIQRPKEFMYQSGLYNPGESWGWLNTGDRRLSRIVAAESVIRFRSLEEARVFFKEGGGYLKWVTNGDGLVLGFLTSPGRDQINIDLYRASLNGKPLRSLPRGMSYPGSLRLNNVQQ